jgi:hypothetical protein
VQLSGSCVIRRCCVVALLAAADAHKVQQGLNRKMAVKAFRRQRVVSAAQLFAGDLAVRRGCGDGALVVLVLAVCRPSMQL